MENKSFLNIGKPVLRNIVNTKEIDTYLNNLIKNKKLDNYPFIEKWINSVVKNHLLQKANINEQSTTKDLNESIVSLIKQANISAPYHLVNLDSELTNTITHCIDYLKDVMPKDKDLSRISFPQAQINSDKWLTNLLTKLSEEEDLENVIPSFTFEDKGQQYTWVNIRSKKGLERESKLMNHCIATYWNDAYQDLTFTTEQTGFFSLRDRNNKPLVTLHQQKSSDEDKKYVINEIKENSNTDLSNQYRTCVEKFINFYEDDVELDSYYSYHFYLHQKKIRSIDYFIHNNINLNNKNPLNFLDFSSDYPLEKLTNIGYFDKINSSLTNIDLSNSYLKADSINLLNTNKKLLKLESNHINLKNMSFMDIHIQGIEYKKEKQNTDITFNGKFYRLIENGSFILENIQNSKITINNKFHNEPNIILKNCHNIEFIFEDIKPIHLEKHTNINFQRHVEEKNSTKMFNFLIIDSSEINIPQIKKNIMYINDKNISLQIFDRPFHQLDCDVNKAVYHSLSSHCATNLINTYLKNLILENFEPFLYNFLNNTEIKINYNENIHPQIEFNKYVVFNEKEGNIIDFIKNPIDYTNKILYSHNENKCQLFFDYENFIKNNAFYILEKKITSTFVNADEIIYVKQKQIKTIFKNNNKLLLEAFKTDNFVSFLSKIYLDFKNHKPSIQNDALTFYIFKNQLLAEVFGIKSVENKATSYRFSSHEQRMKLFNAKRFAKFFTSRPNSIISEKDAVDILMKPFDNNELLIWHSDLKSVIQSKMYEMKINDNINKSFKTNFK